jgi:hypothetical protein
MVRNAIKNQIAAQAAPGTVCRGAGRCPVAQTLSPANPVFRDLAAK